jgi:hypothetical protein
MAAATTHFGEPLPGGALGVVRVAAFAAVVAGAAALAPRHRVENGEPPPRRPAGFRAPSAART